MSMKVYRISAVTLIIKNMERSCDLYSQICDAVLPLYSCVPNVTMRIRITLLTLTVLWLNLIID
jgi:hypothetical protein